jgi:hypothetical protein
MMDGVASRLMAWFRTITAFTRWLVALFLVTQLAGVVPFSSGSEHAAHAASAAEAHHHHHGGPGPSHHGDRTADPADHCCALHAFFAGILPPAIVVDTFAVAATRVVGGPAAARIGAPPGRLDRPPRSLPLI